MDTPSASEPVITHPLPPVAPPWEGIEAWLNMRDDVVYPPHVQETCTGCHGIPDPRMLSTQTWKAALRLMQLINERRLGILYSDEQWADIRQYYFDNSVPTQAMPLLPPDPVGSPIQFEAIAFGVPGDGFSMIGDVNIVDLDQNGRPDVLVCDSGKGLITWIHQPKQGAMWEEVAIANAKFPVRTRLLDFNADGRLDILVSDLGTIEPVDEKPGQVIMLINKGTAGFEPRIIIDNIPKIADVQAGDLDNDGDIDFILGMFGYLLVGELSWLEQLPDGSFRKHLIDERTGPVNVPLIDLNHDGFLDIISLNTQEHEEIICYINNQRGKFEPYIIWQAGIPVFGSAAISLADLDQDGDQDILYTNGDNADLPAEVKPFHGFQWLENLGNLKFKFHDVMRMYGAYRAEAADIDLDGDMDVVVTSMYNFWKDVTARQSVIWLENDGKQHFTGHGIADRPTHLINLAVGDINQDGRPDILSGSLHAGNTDRPGRVTLWLNQGKPGRLPVTTIALVVVAVVAFSVAVLLRKRRKPASSD